MQGALQSEKGGGGQGGRGGGGGGGADIYHTSGPAPVCVELLLTINNHKVAKDTLGPGGGVEGGGGSVVKEKVRAMRGGGVVKGKVCAMRGGGVVKRKVCTMAVVEGQWGMCCMEQVIILCVGHVGLMYTSSSSSSSTRLRTCSRTWAGRAAPPPAGSARSAP